MTGAGVDSDYRVQVETIGLTCTTLAALQFRGLLAVCINAGCDQVSQGTVGLDDIAVWAPAVLNRRKPKVPEAIFQGFERVK